MREGEFDSKYQLMNCVEEDILTTECMVVCEILSKMMGLPST